MTNITAGEAAIARLDTAVDAFEHILTGAEGEVIGVPNHPPQPSLATRVKTSLDALTQSPAQSAAEAAGYAEEAAESLAAAQKLTSVPFEDAPFPDVWAPLNDNLRLLAGFAPADTITVAGTSYSLPTKSMTFTRSTTATYIDKSGVLKTAAVNEPRFEREGLLIEGQSTNYVLNSNEPSLWQSNSTLTKSSIVDGTTQATTYTGTVNAATSANHQATVSSNISVNAGDTVTISGRAKASSDIVRFRFTLDGTDIANIFFNALTGAFISSTAGLTYTTSLGSDGYAYLTATYTAPSAGVVTAGVWLRGNANLAIGTVLYIQMLQVEKNPVATSYIPTGASSVTRAGERVALQPSGNVGYRTIGDAFNRALAFEVSVNKYVTPSVGYIDFVRVAGSNNDIIFRAVSSTLNSYIGGSGPSIAVTYPFASKVYVQTIDSTNTTSIYFDGKSNSRTLAPTTPSSIPTSIDIQGNSNAVFHIRNFRIWHRKLTSNQINGLR
ncbi:phage head spike fiber domain-containing protein [Leclercia sp. CFBP8987]|uniref:phage head spike fiber domain-containing protein n=1 Tax=Leclercia sp. CFBP8987 TaxID=3096525 RepID=UPI002A6A1C76|nr:hypothetical protein [Leclercia sp. CFBP8987]MDY0921911.1 hypothetical protein [Leclercia sp. CFBP8987]